MAEPTTSGTPAEASSALKEAARRALAESETASDRATRMALAGAIYQGRTSLGS